MVPLVTAVAPYHPVLLVVRLRWVILVLTDWTDLKEEGGDTRFHSQIT